MLVNPILIEIAKEIQSLPSFSKFYLAGGTSLSLKFDHRSSDDLDFFCEEQIGILGFEECEKELKEYYGEKISVLYPLKKDDQFIWLRAILIRSGLSIKIDAIQNMKLLNPPEEELGVYMASTEDIGLFKLICSVRRRSRKDFFDLDYISENIIPLERLLERLNEKEEKYGKVEKQTVFDLDSTLTPTDDLNLLLIETDPIEDLQLKMPLNSNEKFSTSPNQNATLMRYRWNKKVRKLS